jgi:hypothetical protein
MEGKSVCLKVILVVALLSEQKKHEEINPHAFYMDTFINLLTS